MPYIPYGYQPGYYGQAMPDQLAQLRQNAYQPPTMPGQAAQQAAPSIIWVQGEEGAKAYMVAALCTVRDELEEAHTPEAQIQALPPATYAAAYSTAAEPQSDFVAAASSVPFGGLMQVLDEHMKAIKLVYPKEYELVMRKISDL